MKKNKRKQRSQEKREARLKRAAEKQIKVEGKKRRSVKTAKTELCDRKNTVDTKIVKPAKIRCVFQEEVYNDVEEEGLKNVGCNVCDNWFHLHCTKFKGMLYEQVSDTEFVCCSCTNVSNTNQ